MDDDATPCPATRMDTVLVYYPGCVPLASVAYERARDRSNRSPRAKMRIWRVDR
jgi:hypothetical protein